MPQIFLGDGRRKALFGVLRRQPLPESVPLPTLARGDARHGVRERPEPRTDDELFQAALQDASALLSAQVTAGDVVDGPGTATRAICSPPC